MSHFYAEQAGWTPSCQTDLILAHINMLLTLALHEVMNVTLIKYIKNSSSLQNF